MKRFFALLICILIVASLLVSCQDSELNLDDVYGTYVQESSIVITDRFYITLSPDGTFQYLETGFSSHVGVGDYSVDGNIITLTETIAKIDNDGTNRIYKFKYQDNKLIFVKSESDEFLYVDLPDGAVFNRAPQE